MKNLRIFDKDEKVDGFNFRPGFAMWEDEKSKCASSGWESGGAMMIYRENNGKWTGEWEYPEDNPDITALKEISQIIEINKCIHPRDELIAEGRLIHESNEPIRFDDPYSEEYYPTDQFGIYEIPPSPSVDGARSEFSVLTELDYQLACKYSDLAIYMDNIEKSGDFEFIRLCDNTVEIINYKGSAENLVIPKTLCVSTETGEEELVVSSIGQCAFVHPDIKTVVIPSSVKRIQDGAFMGCVNLRKVIFSDPQNCDLQYIGDYAFAETAIESISFPSCVECLGDNVLAGNKNLTSVCIPDGFADYVSNIVGVGVSNAEITLISPIDNEINEIQTTKYQSAIVSPMVKGQENVSDTSKQSKQQNQGSSHWEQPLGAATGSSHSKVKKIK